MDSKGKNYQRNRSRLIEMEPRWNWESGEGEHATRNEKWIKHSAVLEDGPVAVLFSGLSRNTITCLMREPMQFSAYIQITAENMRNSGLLRFICIPTVLGVLWRPGPSLVHSRIAVRDHVTIVSVCFCSFVCFLSSYAESRAKPESLSFAFPRAPRIPLVRILSPTSLY